MLMLIDIDKKLRSFSNIIEYLEGMNFLDGATKQISKRFTHKTWSYTLIGK